VEPVYRNIDPVDDDRSRTAEKNIDPVVKGEMIVVEFDPDDTWNPMFDPVVNTVMASVLPERTF
jgi:hypothetical protein